MADLIDDLLELVGMHADALVLETASAHTRDESAAHRLQNDRLIAEFERRPVVAPEGASPAQAEALNQLRFTFTRLAGHHATDPKHLQDAYNALLAEETRVRNDIRKIEALRSKALERVVAAVPEHEAERIAEGALVAEAQPLAARRALLLRSLAAPAKGEPVRPATDYESAIADVNAFCSAVSAVREEIDRRRDARELLERELAEVGQRGVTAPDLIVPGATARDVTPLVDGVAEVARILDDAQSTLSLLSAQSARIGTLKAGKARIGDAVAERLVRRDAIAKASQQIEAGLPEEANVAVLAPRLDTIRLALAAAPLDDTDLATAQQALDHLREDADAEAQEVRERMACRTALRKQREAVDQLIAQTCARFDVEGVTETLRGIGEALDDTLHEIDFDAIESELNEAVKNLDEVLEDVVAQGKRREVAPPVEYLLEAAALAVAEGKRLEPFAGQFLAGLKKLPAQEQSVQEALAVDAPDEPVGDEEVSKSRGGKAGRHQKSAPKNTSKSPPRSKPVPTQEAFAQAFSIVTAMREAIDEARGDGFARIQAIADLRDGLLARIAAGIPAGLPPGFDAILEARRRGVSDQLGDAMSPAITNKVLQQASDGTAAFEADLRTAADIAARWGEAAKRFDVAKKDARPPLQAALDAQRAAVLQAGQLAADRSDLRAALALCEKLLSSISRVASEAGQAIGARQALAQVEVEGRKLDAAAADLAYDLAGPEAAKLEPAALKTLCTCFGKASKDGRQALRELVCEGFGGESRVLLGLLRGGDADAILALAQGYGGPPGKDDREKLRGLVAQGGLGEQSHVLDDMVGYGVADAADQDQQRRQNVERLKSLGAAFGDAQGPARMKTLLADCGLGQARTETPPRPGILAELLQGEGGLGGDGAELRKFADGFSGTGATAETDRARLKGLVEQGGFGARPKAFAPLVQALSKANGGMAKAVTEIKKVGQTFEAPQDRARLKALLDDGGMSGDAKGVVRQHEHPDTLAKVFIDGLDGRADKLKNFTDAFGDTGAHAEQARKMLEAWNEFPDTAKASRQPGKMVRKLLEPQHLGGDVRKLQTKFTTGMDAFGDAGKRKLATRFAPYFDRSNPEKSDRDAKPDPMPAGVNKIVMDYILKRHVPRFVQDGSKSNGDDWLEASNSYFPVETSAQELADIIGDAMAQANAPGLGGDASVTLPNGMRVHIALKTTGAVPHCYPESGAAPPDPGEIARFTKAEAQRIFAAIKP